MKNYLTFIKENQSENFFYTIEKGKFLICDINHCSKSERTFDIKSFDLAKNKDLLEILKLTYFPKIKDFCIYLSEFIWQDRKKRYDKLMKNPTLRILVEDKELFIDVLRIFNPKDPRVIIAKYNL